MTRRSRSRMRFRLRSRLAPLAVVVAGVLATAGCGGSGSDNFAVGTLDPQRLANAGLLTIDAFPPPWRAVKNTADPAGFDRCKDIAAALTRGRQARLTSSEFAAGNDEQAEQSVSVYDSGAGAGLVMRTVRLDAFRRCLQDRLTMAARQALAGAAGMPPATPDTTPGNVTTRVSALSVPARGAERVSYQVVVSTAGSGGGADVYVDVDLMRVDRVVVALLSQRRGAPPMVDRNRLLSILTTRIDAALGSPN